MLLMAEKPTTQADPQLPALQIQGLTADPQLSELVAKLNEQLDEPTKAAVLYHIARNADEVRVLLDLLEIMNTPSAFDDPEDAGGKKVQTLEEVATSYSFRDWLTEQQIAPHEATKLHVMAWWDYFKNRCKDRGYTPGTINQAGFDTDLWKGTAALSQKMKADPKKYGYLPWQLVNQPEVVSKALQQDIEDPEAWIEILVGETMEDMEKSDSFLQVFSTTDKDVPLKEKATGSIELILGKDKFAN